MRIPPGRSGRIWLTHRLELARRGAELLDQKRHVLLAELVTLDSLVVATRREWEDSAKEARRWLGRAALTGGERQLRLALERIDRPAELDLTWRSSMGVVYPNQVAARLPELPDIASLGGSSALALAAVAHHRAVHAALRNAAAEAGYRRISRELSATVRRLRAIERRWIPRYEEALAERQLALDEAEREDVVRTRWAVSRPSVGEIVVAGSGRGQV